jgi:hypothetical protein
VNRRTILHKEEVKRKATTMQKEKKESNIKCEKKLENVGLKLEFWFPFILVLGLTTTPTIFLPF